jgi:hypothetical protein
LVSTAACVAISLWIGQHVVHYAAGLSVPLLVLMAGAVVWLGAQERAATRGTTAAVAP